MIADCQLWMAPLNPPVNGGKIFGATGWFFLPPRLRGGLGFSSRTGVGSFSFVAQTANHAHSRLSINRSNE